MYLQAFVFSVLGKKVGWRSLRFSLVDRRQIQRWNTAFFAARRHQFMAEKTLAAVAAFAIRSRKIAIQRAFCAVLSGVSAQRFYGLSAASPWFCAGYVNAE